jgi:hypothetical protein
MKKVVVLLIVLAALIAVAVFSEKGLMQRISSSSRTGTPMRELLVPEVAGKEIGGLRIHEGDKKVSLSLANGKWTVAERDGYPASFDKVQRAVKAISEMKIKGKQQVGKSLYAETQLLPPGEGASGETGGLIELLDVKGDVVASFIVGGSTTTTGGASSSGNNMMGGPGEMRYARVVGGKDGDTVWFVEDNFYELGADPKDWVDKSFLDVRGVASAEITRPVAAESWKAARKNADAPFTLENAAPGEELDTAKADGLSNVLSGATFTDVLPKKQATPEFMKDAVHAKFVTFDGFTYDITALAKNPGGKDASEKDYISIKVSADFAKERKAPAGEKPEDKKKADDEFAAKKKSLEDKLAKEKLFEGWVYEVPNYTVGITLKKRADVLRDKQPAASAPAPGGSLPNGTSIPPVAPGPIKPPAPLPPTPPAATPPAAPAPASPAPPAKATEGKPAAAAPPTKPKEATPPAAKPSVAKPAETTPPAPPAAKPAETKPADPTNPEGKPVEVNPTPKAKPTADAKPAGAKPAAEAKSPGQ